MNFLKCSGIVLTSRETRTRPDSAAIRRTSGSEVPSGITPAAARKSMEAPGVAVPLQSTDLNPRPLETGCSRPPDREIALGALEAVDHLRRERIVGFERFPLIVLRLQIRIDLLRVLQDKSDGTVHP